MLAILQRTTEKEIVDMRGASIPNKGINTGYSSAMWRLGVGDMNGNGIYLMGFCADNNWVIKRATEGIRQLTKQHGYPWLTHSHNQMDHICTGQNFRRFLFKVRVGIKGMCRVLHGDDMLENFYVKTGVPSFLFLLTIAWVMTAISRGERNGMQLILFHLPHNREQMQAKTMPFEDWPSSIAYSNRGH